MDARPSVVVEPSGGHWLRFLGSIVRPLPLPALTNAAVRGLVRVVGALEARVFLVDAERRELRLAAHDGLLGGSRDPVRLDFADPHPIARVALDRGLRVVVKPVPAPPHPPGETGEHRIADTMVLAPLFAEQPLGCLTCRFGGPVASHDVTALSTAAHVLSAMLASATLRNELRDREGLDAHFRSSAIRQRHVFDGTVEMQWILSPLGTVLDANNAALRLLDSSLQTMVAKPIWSGTWWPSPGETESFFRDALSSAVRGEIGRGSLQVRGPDAAWVKLQLTVAPVRDETGDIAVVVVEARNETTDGDARDSVPGGDEGSERQWLEAMIEHAPVAILLLRGSDGSLVCANPSAARLLGQRMSAGGGLSDYQGRVAGADGAPLADPWAICRRALAGETTSSRELRLATPDGRELTVLASAAPVMRASDGAVDGAVVVLEDISEIRELQTLREQWTAVITHDLKQPIQALTLGISKLELDEGRIAPSSIARLRRSIGALTRMVTDLGHRSAIEVREIPLRIEATDVVRLASGVAETMGVSRVRVFTAGAIPEIEADAQRIEQVLTNLVANARKYGHTGTEIRIGVSLSEDRRMVVVSVTNHGDGIEPDDLEKIFGRFFRGGQHRRSRSEGLGLGLYICKELIVAHGGHIWAESEKGGTTSVHFSLPVERQADAE